MRNGQTEPTNARKKDAKKRDKGFLVVVCLVAVAALIGLYLNSLGTTKKKYIGEANKIDLIETQAEANEETYLSPYEDVYVSGTNVFHINPSCIRSQEPIVMKYAQAKAHGYQPCGKCLKGYLFDRED